MLLIGGVMKKILIILSLILALVITGCTNTKKNIPKKEETKQEEIKIYEGDTTNDITMTIKEGTLTNSSATLIIKELKKKDYIYSGAIAIYKNDGNNWVLMPSSEAVNIRTIAYHTDKNGILELGVAFFQELEPGEYKLAKSASLLDDDKKYNFSINIKID